jgi:hypothetical protein
MDEKELISPANIKVRPRGLHSFAFNIVIFDVSLQPLNLRPSSLAPNPSFLAPNVIVRKYLRVNKLLYICRESSTNTEDSLQIKLFLQNKAKFRKVKLNVNKVLTRIYDELDTWSIRKNKPKTNPNEPKFKKTKMNVTNYITMDFENKSNWSICENEPNSNPICTGIVEPVSKGSFTHG